MQNQQTRAAAALKLINTAITADDQECVDFLCQTIEREQLFFFYTSDAGEPIRNMEEFVVDLGVEPESMQVARVVASAANFTTDDGVRFTPRRMTREERYQERIANNK